MQNGFLIEQGLQRQLQDSKGTNPPIAFGMFPYNNDDARLESPDLRILVKALSEYASGGLSKKEKKELAQISEVFKQLSNIQIKTETTPCGKIIPGEMSVVNSNGEKTSSSHYFNVPDVIQNLFTDKSKIIAEALKHYSLDGVLTEQEQDTIGKLSNIMSVQNPIPSGVRGNGNAPGK